MNAALPWIAAHKVVLGVGGAGAVATLAYVRSRSESSTSSTGTTTSTTGSSGTAAAAGAAYDSSSSDVYNALQPTLEGLDTQLSTLTSLFTTSAATVAVPANTVATTTTPTVATPSVVPASSDDLNAAAKLKSLIGYATANPDAIAASSPQAARANVIQALKNKGLANSAAAGVS